MNSPRFFFPLILSFAFAGCNSLPDWMGTPDDPPLPGERIAVLSFSGDIKPDTNLEDVPVTLPAPEQVADWPQEGGNAENHLEHVAYAAALTKTGSARIGDGSAWESALITLPVVAGGKIFAMDAKGYISAHEVADISHVAWLSKSAVEKDEPEILGGGLAYSGGVLYVTTGYGRVVALDAGSGKELWKQSLGISLHGAPRLLDGKLFVVAVDSQLFALKQQDGALLWTHRGISETAGFLSMVTPAASGNIVIAPYESGELHALQMDSGEEIWSDSLLLPQRTSATSVFTGIDSNPVIAAGVLYAAGSGGLMAANDLPTGRRVWEQEISSTNAPWVAGDFLYAVSSKAEVVCLHAQSGRVKWVRALDQFADKDKKERISWAGPVLAGGQVIVVNARGQAVLISPTDGSITATREIPEGILTPPIIADGVMYLVGRDATLYALK